jgi:hypothetical protein
LNSREAKENEMSQARREFAYDQLHCMSFIQLFHLLVAIANRTWLTNLERAAENERWLPSLPSLVAGFRSGSTEAVHQRTGGNGSRLRERDERW